MLGRVIPMTDVTATETPSTLRRRPLFSTLSLLSPLVGVGLFFAIAPLQGSDADVGRLLLGLALVPVCLVCGIILAVVALGRTEKWRVLPWLGLALNAGPILYVIIRQFLR